MSQRGRLRLAATLPATSEALATVVAHLSPGLPEDDLQAVELGLAEVLSNIARHGFDDGETGRITLHWAMAAGRVMLQVTDCGRPIPSELLASAAHRELAFDQVEVADLPESGLGLALVMQMFDIVAYRSRGEVNRLQLCRVLG